MNTLKKFTIILSAYRGNNSDIENLLATEKLATLLTTHNFTGVPFTRAVGVYQGHCEQSFIISTNSSNTVNDIKRLAWFFNQDCVLVSNNQAKRIQLHYPESTHMKIGERFAINSKLEGNNILSYTIVNGIYWEVV